MKKALIATAVASAIAVPAMAQNVTLSGRASMEVGNWKATGSAAGSASDFKNRTRVADTGSRFTFAVSEDLGGGLRAGVYCETGINIDNGGSTDQAGVNNANTSEWCSREGRAFIGNQLGEIRLGRQNVFWTQGALNPLGSTFIGSDVITATIISGGSAVYTTRGENMIKLLAGPTFGKFANSEVYMGYMGNSGGLNNQTAGANAANTSGEAAGANANAAGKYQGFKVNFSDGPLFAMWDNQSSKAAGSAAATPNDRELNRSANKIGAGYRFGPTTVALQWADKSRTVVSTGLKREDTSYALLAQHSMGATMLHFGYAVMPNYKERGATVVDTGANAYTLGVTYNLSKRTHLYGSYHNIDNKAAGLVNMAGGGYQGGTPAAGADTTAYGVGIIHNF